jgi:hypothetical protein
MPSNLGCFAGWPERDAQRDGNAERSSNAYPGN